MPNVDCVSRLFILDFVFLVFLRSCLVPNVDCVSRLFILDFVFLLFFFVLVLCPMLIVSLDCSFLILFFFCFSSFLSCAQC